MALIIRAFGGDRAEGEAVVNVVNRMVVIQRYKSYPSVGASRQCKILRESCIIKWLYLVLSL